MRHVAEYIFNWNKCLLKRLTVFFQTNSPPKGPKFHFATNKPRKSSKQISSVLFPGWLGVSVPARLLRYSNTKIFGLPLLVHADPDHHRRPADARDKCRVSQTRFYLSASSYKNSSVQEDQLGGRPPVPAAQRCQVPPVAVQHKQWVRPSTYVYVCDVGTPRQDWRAVHPPRLFLNTSKRKRPTQPYAHSSRTAQSCRGPTSSPIDRPWTRRVLSVRKLWVSQ